MSSSPMHYEFIEVSQWIKIFPDEAAPRKVCIKPFFYTAEFANNFFNSEDTRF